MSSVPARLPIRRSRSEMRSGLASVFEGPAPYLSVYLDVTPGDRRESAGERLGVAAARREGVSPAQVEAARRGLSDLADDDALYAAVVDAGGTMVWAGYPDPPGHDLVELSPLPRLGPFLNAEQSLTHHVVALVDGDTLTLMVVPRHGDTSHQVTAFDDHAAVIERIVTTAQGSRTTLVLLCGPAHLVNSLRPAIEQTLGVDTTLTLLETDELTGSRPGHDASAGDAARVDHDADHDRVLATAIVKAVATHAAEKTVGLLRLWRFHQAHGEAVEDVEGCLAAIAAHHAALVLVHDDPDDQRWAWFGSDPHRVALHPDQAAPTGDGEALRRARLIDVVLRSALLSGAGSIWSPTSRRR